MKKLFIVSLSAILFFAACKNDGSPSIGSYDKDESSQTTGEDGDANKEHNTLESGSAAFSDTTGVHSEGKDSLDK